MSARRVELVELLLLLCVVAVFYFVVIPAGIQDPDGFALSRGLPPSFSARLVSVLVAVILLSRMVRLFLTGGGVANPSAPLTHADIGADDADTAGAAIEPTAESLPVHLSPRVWIGVAVSLLFAFGLIPLLGFALASLITLAVMLFVLGERSARRLVLFPILVSAAVWLLFTQMLSVKLPAGFLFALISGT